jgi:hypothetical protein
MFRALKLTRNTEWIRMLHAGQLPPEYSTKTVTLDRRTGNARRVAELAADFTAALGGMPIDSLKRDAIERAAELQVTAESLRRARLNGDHTISPEAIVKAENLADRARRSLRIGDAPVRTVRSIRARLRAGG